MKRSITYKVSYTGRRANAPSTEAGKAKLAAAFPGSTVTTVKTTEGNLRPGTPAPSTAHALVEAILGVVALGKVVDATTAAQVRRLAEQAKATLGAPATPAAR